MSHKAPRRLNKGEDSLPADDRSTHVGQSSQGRVLCSGGRSACRLLSARATVTGHPCCPSPAVSWHNHQPPPVAGWGRGGGSVKTLVQILKRMAPFVALLALAPLIWNSFCDSVGVGLAIEGGFRKIWAVDGVDRDARPQRLWLCCDDKVLRVDYDMDRDGSHECRIDVRREPVLRYYKKTLGYWHQVDASESACALMYKNGVLRSFEGGQDRAQAVGAAKREQALRPSVEGAGVVRTACTMPCMLRPLAHGPMRSLRRRMS